MSHSQTRAQIAASRVHFPSKWLRQVSCYTLLSRCQPPWPPSCCLKQFTSLMGSDAQFLLGLVTASGASHVASPAYQEVAHLKPGGSFCPIDSLTIVRESTFSHCLSSCLDCTDLTFSFSYPEGNFEDNQLQDSSMGLSPLHPKSRRAICTSVPWRSSN